MQHINIVIWPENVERVLNYMEMCVEGLASDRATDAVASYAGQMTTVDVNKMMAKVVPAGFITRLTLTMGLSHRHVGCMCLATSMCMLKLFNSVVSLSTK
jgi:hypothetical protein